MIKSLKIFPIPANESASCVSQDFQLAHKCNDLILVDVVFVICSEFHESIGHSRRQLLHNEHHQDWLLHHESFP